MTDDPSYIPTDVLRDCLRLAYILRGMGAW
jgi:hypothetical protein